LYPFC